MSGKWHAYSTRDAVTVYELNREQPWAFGTRGEAIAFLRRQLEREHKAAQERAAELGRALESLLGLEKAP